MNCPIGRNQARRAWYINGSCPIKSGEQRKQVAWEIPSEAERRLWLYTPTDQGGIRLGSGHGVQLDDTAAWLMANKYAERAKAGYIATEETCDTQGQNPRKAL